MFSIYRDSHDLWTNMSVSSFFLSLFISFCILSFFHSCSLKQDILYDDFNKDCLTIMPKFIYRYTFSSAWTDYKKFEPVHDKTYNKLVQPAKTQISLHIHLEWHGFSFILLWIA